MRMRAIITIDGWRGSSVFASGHTVFDLGMARRFRRGVELNFALDNLQIVIITKLRTTLNRGCRGRRRFSRNPRNPGGIRFCNVVMNVSAAR